MNPLYRFVHEKIYNFVLYAFLIFSQSSTLWITQFPCCRFQIYYFMSPCFNSAFCRPQNLLLCESQVSHFVNSPSTTLLITRFPFCHLQIFSCCIILWIASFYLVDFKFSITHFVPPNIPLYRYPYLLSQIFSYLLLWELWI